jgi:hypothetical protein
MRRSWRAVFVTVLIALTACGGGAEESARPDAAAPSAPDLGALALLVPEGAEVVVTARPVELMEAPATRTIIDAVFDEAQRDGFAQRTGVEPHEVEEVVVAEYEGGFAIIARGPWAARDVVIATESRMTSVEVRADEPFVRRMGFLGTERRDVSAIADDVVLFTSAMPDVTASILDRVRTGRFGHDRAALATTDLMEVVERYEDAPLALYVPEPLELPPELGLSVLLARQRALAAVATPAGPSRAAVGVQLIGEFPATAEENFETLVTSIASQDLGAALGMREALPTLSVQVGQNSVLVGLELHAETLALGLRTLFGGEIAELLQVPVREQ